MSGCRRLLIVLLLSSTAVLYSQQPDKVLEDGRSALKDGVYDFARKQFEQYIELKKGKLTSEERAEVYDLMARTFYQQKKYDELLKFLADINSFALKEKGLKPFWTAMVKYGRAEYADAEKSVRNFSKNYEGSRYASKALRLSAWCLVKQGKDEDAVKLFEQFDTDFKKDEERHDNMLEWARALIRIKREKDAVVVLERLVKESGVQRVVQEGQLLLGLVMAGSGSHDEAIDVFKTLASNTHAAGDVRAEGWYNIAASYKALTNYNMAISAMTNGLSLAQSLPVKRKGSLQLGEICLVSGFVSDGVKLLKDYVSEQPDASAAHGIQLELSGALLDSKQYERAVEEYQHYIETFTNTLGLASAHYGRGWGLVHLKRHAEAATCFQKAYELHQDPIKKERALFKVGDSYFLNSQYKLAADTFKKLLAEFTESKLKVNMLFQLAESSSRAKLYPEAEKVFLQVVESFPKNTLAEESLLRLGEIKEGQGSFRDAISYFSRLLGEYPKGTYVPDALMGRGLVYFKQWRFKLALNDFEKIVNNFSESRIIEKAYYKRAMCYYWLGQDERSLEICQRFIRTYPKSRYAPAVLFWIGKYHFNHTSYKDAERTFKQFAERYADNPLADNSLIWAGRSLARQKEYVESIEMFAKLIKEYPTSPLIPEARFAQAEASRELANYSEAILIFNEIINNQKLANSQLVQQARMRKGDCQFMLGAQDSKRYEEAAATYRVVANSSKVRVDLQMESLYKIGRCLQKMERSAEAMEHYYQKIILKYFENSEKGVFYNRAAQEWFSKAAGNAADIAVEREEWKSAVSILERVVQSGVNAAEDAKKKIEKLKSDHWLLFH